MILTTILCGRIVLYGYINHTRGRPCTLPLPAPSRPTTFLSLLFMFRNSLLMIIYSFWSKVKGTQFRLAYTYTYDKPVPSRENYSKGLRILNIDCRKTEPICLWRRSRAYLLKVLNKKHKLKKKPSKISPTLPNSVLIKIIIINKQNS